MMKYFFLLSLSLLYLTGCKPAIPDRPAATLKLDDAPQIYQTHLQQSLSGIYEHENLVFAIAVLPYNKKAKQEPEFAAIHKVNKMLQEKYTLPKKYSLKSLVIENKIFYRKKIFRYVQCFLLDEIKKISSSNTK